ncbi:cuticle protein 7 isoform X2 [Daphnia magna]|uniref:cuticle protein 7 isoform X2 n=1 Tax=Daphnia magna TaxID=35525 RepID=UPI001E1BB684|nr:cuticle protein 7 isoform X2 [Daphnia magna]
MKSTIACLLVLAVAAQAQYFGNYGYGLGGYGGYYGGYYPYASVVPSNAVPAAVPTAVRAAVPAAYPVAYGYPSFTASQYHAQDELGQASYGYAHPGQSATNLRDAFGNQVGSYAYLNPEGKEVRVSYTADSRGFRVLSNDLPVAPVANLVAPVPVQDTPEVAAAKAQFAIKYAEAKAAATPAAAPVRAKRQILSYGAAPFAYNYPGYNYPGHNYPGYNYGYAAAPFAYNFAAPAAVAAPAVPVRDATLTKTVLTPGHAVAYRVD